MIKAGLSDVTVMRNGSFSHPISSDGKKDERELQSVSIAPSSSTSFQKLLNISKKDKIFINIVFTCVGLGCLIPFNIILNAVPNVIETKFNKESLFDTIIATYQTLNLFTQACFLYFGPLKKKIFVSSFFMFVVVLIAMPLCINFADGNTGKGLLYFLSAVIGLVTGICSATSFAIGAVLPQNTCGYIAFGYGISGLLSFGIWMICTKGIWNLTLGNNFLYASCWTIFCIGAFICFLTGILLIVILRKDAIKNSLKNVITVKNNNNNNNNIDAGVITEYSETINNNSNKNDSTDDVYHDKRSSFCCHSTNEEDLLSRNWKAIVYDCRYELFNIFFTMWLTLFIFPVIGPFNWNGVNLSQKDILTGIFQIGDFFGRYLPNLTILRAKTKLLLVLVISRIIFIPLFMLCFKLTNNCFFNALWFQVILMLTFALTNGWFITNSLCNLPNCVIRNKEKGSIGLYASIVILIGIVCGSWMTKLLII